MSTIIKCIPVNSSVCGNSSNQTSAFNISQTDAIRHLITKLAYVETDIWVRGSCRKMKLVRNRLFSKP